MLIISVIRVVFELDGARHDGILRPYLEQGPVAETTGYILLGAIIFTYVNTRELMR